MPLVEALYAVALAAVAAVLIAATLRTESRVDALDPNPAVTIRVDGFRWGWRFFYPQGRISVVGDRTHPPTLNVPTDETVRFELTSRDVIHSFWIPELRFKRDAFPGRTTSFDLVFDSNTIGRCAEFCGIGHDGMTFGIAAMSPAGFDSWRRAAAKTGGGSS